MNKNYIPLYRKYRPQTIEQIVGQEHIKKALANAIQMDRISHAYLFTGPRGTGKTSTARIFAKSLNCEKGPTVSPCNECENCKNITNSIPIDVIEIDAASNRSVNDADEIIQKVALAPVQSRYKIYIIDEVHMLTNQAFNALLKTLEEPPKNVIFILATTEVHKVLDTIKSRCQRFDFKRITTEDISKHLRYISDKEGINITDDALSYIAQNSAGGMRDSIALLDQLSVLNSADSPISVDDINRLLGRLSFKSLTSLFENIVSSNQNEALNVLNEIYNQGNEPSQILANMLEYLRNSLIVKSVDNSSLAGVVQLNEEQIKILAQKVKSVEVHQIISLTNKCASYIKELKQTANPKLWLDVAILDMANLVENTTLEDLQKRISMLESGGVVRTQSVGTFTTPPSPVIKHEVHSQVKPSVEPVNTEIKQKQQNSQNAPSQKVPEFVNNNSTEEEVLNNPVPMSKPAQGNGLKSLWIKFLENVSSFPSRAILKQQALPVKITKDEVILSIKNPSWLKKFGPEGSKYPFIEEATKALFAGSAPKIIVRAPEANDDKIRAEQSSSDDDLPAPEPKKPLILDKPEVKKEDVNDALEVKKSFSPSSNNLQVESLNKSSNSTSQSLHKSNTTQISKTIADKVSAIKPMNSGDIDSSYHSDNVNMVMELFEGKFID